MFNPIFQGLAISLLVDLASSILLTVLVIPAIYIVLRGDRPDEVAMTNAGAFCLSCVADAGKREPDTGRWRYRRLIGIGLPGSNGSESNHQCPRISNI